MLNPYEVLGVPIGTDKAQCKRAYRKLCARYHPDNNGDADKFDLVNKAWSLIESDNFVIRQKKKHLVHKSLFSFVTI